MQPLSGLPLVSRSRESAPVMDQRLGPATALRTELRSEPCEGAVLVACDNIMLGGHTCGGSEWLMCDVPCTSAMRVDAPAAARAASSTASRCSLSPGVGRLCLGFHPVELTTHSGVRVRELVAASSSPNGNSQGSYASVLVNRPSSCMYRASSVRSSSTHEPQHLPCLRARQRANTHWKG